MCHLRVNNCYMLTLICIKKFRSNKKISTKENLELSHFVVNSSVSIIINGVIPEGNLSLQQNLFGWWSLH